MWNKSIPKDLGPPLPPPEIENSKEPVKYKTLNTTRSVTNKFDDKMSKKMNKLNKAIIADQTIAALGDKIKGKALESIDHL
jgi:hypothetical protein